MNKSINILKSLNNINDNLLIETNDLIRENKSKEFFTDKIKKFRNSKSKYVANSICAIGIFCVFIFYIVYSNEISNNKLKQEIAKEDISQQNTENQSNTNLEDDNIIFNENDTINNTTMYLDIDGKFVESDLVSEFDFISNISIPEDFLLYNQGKLYVKDNINDKDYSKIRQYTIDYTKGETGTEQYLINVTFTKEENILGCMPLDENNFNESTINGKNVKLFKGRKWKEALFEYQGFNFYIETYRITEAEFINLLKSILV